LLPRELAWLVGRHRPLNLVDELGQRLRSPVGEEIIADERRRRVALQRLPVTGRALRREDRTAAAGLRLGVDTVAPGLPRLRGGRNSERSRHDDGGGNSGSGAAESAHEEQILTSRRPGAQSTVPNGTIWRRSARGRPGLLDC